MTKTNTNSKSEYSEFDHSKNLKGEIIIQFRKDAIEHILAIRNYKSFEEECKAELETSDSNQDFFSLYMNNIPQPILPIIRYILSFVQESSYDSELVLLNIVPWNFEDGSLNNLLHYAQKTHKIYNFLRKLCEDPESMVPMDKRVRLIDYKLLKEDFFSFMEWKRANFVVIDHMLDIIDITLEVLVKLDSLPNKKQSSQTLEAESTDGDSQIQRKIKKYISLDDIKKSLNNNSESTKLHAVPRKRTNKKLNTVVVCPSSSIKRNKYANKRMSVVLPPVTKSFNDFDFAENNDSKSQKQKVKCCEISTTDRLSSKLSQSLENIDEAIENNLAIKNKKDLPKLNNYLSPKVNRTQKFLKSSGSLAVDISEGNPQIRSKTIKRKTSFTMAKSLFEIDEVCRTNPARKNFVIKTVSSTTPKPTLKNSNLFFKGDSKLNN